MPNDFIKMTGNLDITSTKDKKLRSIESFDYEILPSGVVIKLIDYPFEEIYYQVIKLLLLESRIILCPYYLN